MHDAIVSLCVACTGSLKSGALTSGHWPEQTASLLTHLILLAGQGWRWPQQPTSTPNRKQSSSACIWYTAAEVHGDASFHVAMVP